VEKSLEDDRNVLVGKQGVLEGLKGTYDALRDKNTQCQAALQAAQDR
jgi:hypothetical protein